MHVFHRLYFFYNVGSLYISDYQLESQNRQSLGTFQQNSVQQKVGISPVENSGQVSSFICSQTIK